jgi:hypothetical protein
MGEWEKKFAASLPRPTIKLGVFVALWACLLLVLTLHIDWPEWLTNTVAWIIGVPVLIILGLVALGIGVTILEWLWWLRRWIIFGVITIIALHFVFKYW